MNFIHYKNDFTIDINLSSITTGLTIDPDVIYSIKFFTRKNGTSYKCCFMNNTLVKHDGYVTAVINQPCLEPGVLHYIVEYQINDSTYPDAHKRIFQEFTSDIELCKGNGDTLDIDVQAMFGDTIDDKFNSYDASILALGTATTALNASILGITQKNSIQDASINRIEDIISTIDGGTSGSIDRLDTSVNALSRDVSALNSSVSTLTTEQETMSQNLSNVTNTVNDVSTRVDGFESALANKADVSVLSNYYTTGETYTKSEVDRAIADAALDGELPAGVVVDANYVHTDNNYTTEDKNKVRDFDLTGYPTNSSLVANYATKTELQNVDNNHPTNASVNSTYLKKSELAGELSDYPTNSSVVANYAKKNDISTFVSIADVSFWVSEEGLITGNDVSQFTTERYVNENYVSWENLDEAVFNIVDNNYDVQWKINEVVNDSSVVTDISTHVSDVSVKVIDVSLKVSDISTKLDRDYLNASLIARDYVTNASLVSNYTTKDEFNEVWTTGFLTQDSADELYAKTTDISTFISENDVSTFITEDDFALHSWGAIGLKNDVVINRAALGSDVSNYMWYNPIEFKTLSDYLSDTYTSKLDMSDYLTNDDISNFVTDNDISTFITENDASIYLTDNDVSNYLTEADMSNYVSYSNNGDSQKQIDFTSRTNLFVDLSKFRFYNYNSNARHSHFILDNGNNNGFLRYYFGGTGPNTPGNNYTGIRFSYNTPLIFLISHGYGDNNTYEILTEGNWQNYIDVSSYLTENDASIYLTENDVSVYATTSYVDTQIGNIQNILLTI